MSVPGYFTESEKKAILDAAKIIKMNISKLMNDSSAITLDYGIFRKKDLTSDEKRVVFVDFGHSKTGIFVSSFTKEKASIIA